MFIVGIFSNRGWKTYLLLIFVIGFCFKCLFALDVGPLWHSKHVLRIDFHMFMHCLTYMCSVCTLSV